MSEMDEKRIHERLERLSRVEPNPEATERAKQKVRDTLGRGRPVRLSRATTRGRPYGLVAKLAVAAVLMIGAGFLAGRLSAPKPLDVEELRAAMETSLKSSLEQSIRRELLDEVESRVQSALAADRDTLKQELHQQVAGDLQLFADQTLTAVGNLTDQRFMEFARMIEAARVRERQRVAAAFDYMGSRFGDGLVTLAAHTNEQQRPGQN
ncbi:MAG: hypothetical protein P8Z79_11530 [Sedimentisphaerales bacterium]|jgi:hypothetical protein